MKENDPAKKGSRIGIKALIIVGISLALLFPVGMLTSIVKERQNLAEEVKEDIARGAGGRLILAGPFIVVPVTEVLRNGSVEEHEAIILPTKLGTKADTKAQLRSRGIYSCPVIAADITMAADFDIDTQAIHSLWTGSTSVHLDRARIILEIPDPRALAHTPRLEIKGTALAMSADVSPLRYAAAAMGSPLALEEGSLEVALDMSSTGGAFIGVWPLANSFELAISGDWPTPSFTGESSPIERNLEENGFTARWYQAAGTSRWPKVFDAATNRHQFGYSEFQVLGVEFFDPVGIYHKSERALKYAILFIVMPFIAIFLFEIFTRRRLHPIQYALVGLADVVFYALLLSLSEHIGFTAAYLSSALAVLGLIVFYAASILGSIRRGLVLAPLLVILYGYLYAALQSRDYALLFGSLGVFVILATIMIITRKVDWYRTGNTNLD